MTRVLQGVADRVLARALDLQDVPDQFGRGLVVVVGRRGRRGRPGGLGGRRLRAAVAAAAAGVRRSRDATAGRAGPPSGVCSSTSIADSSGDGVVRRRRVGRLGRERMRSARGSVRLMDGVASGQRAGCQGPSDHPRAVPGCGEGVDPPAPSDVVGDGSTGPGPVRARSSPPRRISGRRAEAAAAAELEHADHLEDERPEPVDHEEEHRHQHHRRQHHRRRAVSGRPWSSTRPCSSRLRWRSGTRRTAGTGRAGR